jgi:hypothetical protein
VHPVAGTPAWAAQRVFLTLPAPDADQVARQIMPFRQAMDHLAGDELLRDLTFECDAVITVLRHGLSSENLEGRSIPQIPIYRSAAAHPNRGTKVQRRCHARQHRRQLRSRLMVVPQPDAINGRRSPATAVRAGKQRVFQRHRTSPSISSIGSSFGSDNAVGRKGGEILEPRPSNKSRFRPLRLRASSTMTKVALALLHNCE